MLLRGGLTSEKHSRQAENDTELIPRRACHYCQGKHRSNESPLSLGCYSAHSITQDIPRSAVIS